MPLPPVGYGWAFNPRYMQWERRDSSGKVVEVVTAKAIHDMQGPKR